MKTDKDAAHEYAEKCKDNPVQWDALLRGFLAGCKYKKESRWIPVSKDLPTSHNDVLIIEHDGKMMVDQMVWFGSTLDWKSTTPVAWTNLPTPPQTNK